MPSRNWRNFCVWGNGVSPDSYRDEKRHNEVEKIITLNEFSTAPVCRLGRLEVTVVTF